MEVNYQQISYMTLIGVHSTMHPNVMQLLLTLCTPLPPNTPYVLLFVSQSTLLLSFNLPYPIQYHRKLHVCMHMYSNMSHGIH